MIRVFLIYIYIRRIFASVAEGRKNKSAFWFVGFVIAGYRTKCTDDVFVNFFGFPQAFMIGRFQGNIVYIMIKIYGVIVSTMIMFGNIVVKGIQKGVVFESTGFNPQEKLSDPGGFQGFSGEFVSFEVLVCRGKGDCFGYIQVTGFLGVTEFQEISVEGSVNKIVFVKIATCYAGHGCSCRGHSACQFQHVLAIDGKYCRHG